MGTLDEILATREPAPAQETQEQATPAAEVSEAVEQAAEQQPEGQEGAEPSKDGKTPVGAIRRAAEEKADKRYTAVLDGLRKEIAERDAAWENRVAKMLEAQRPKAEPQPAPDIFENPEAFVQRQTQPLYQALQEQREQVSQMMAVEKFGQEAVAAAYAELEKRFGQDPQAAQADHVRIMRSPHPFGALVQWHQRQQALAEIGDDPAAYKAKVEAEIMAKLQANGGGEQQQVQQEQPARIMPSNFATARNVGARSGPAWAGPAPLNDIFSRKR
jgi:hypothetical protein